MNDSCLSGVRINRGKMGLSIATADKLTAEQAAALPANLAAIQSALVDPSYAALQNVVEFPLTFVFSSNVKLANWKALEAACKKKRDADNCPYGNFFETAPYGAQLSITPVKMGELVVGFWPGGGMISSWRLKWRNGAWRLRAAEVENQQQD